MCYDNMEEGKFSPTRMNGHDSSDQDNLPSDSEESIENDDLFENHLQDLLSNSRFQTSLDRATSQEKNPVPADLEDLGRTLFLKDSEKRHKQLYGAHFIQGSFASEGSGVLTGACVPGTSTLEAGDAEHFRMELSDNLSSGSLERPAVGAVELMEGKKPELLEIERKEQVYREQRARRRRREREERELWEAESWQQQQEAITASSQWLCQHYQRHCNLQFPCCTQFYPCHRCHNISRACENEEAKACHATHLKCCYCQHEQEIGEGSARCRKCGREMAAYFCSICKLFTSLDKNPYHCEKCGICRIQQEKSFHCEMCNVCLDKRLKGNHQCRQNSGRSESCIGLEDAFSGCQVLPDKGCANDAVTQNSIRVDHNHGLCICNSCLSFRENALDQEVSPVLPIYAESSCNSSTKNRADIDDNNCAQTSSTDASVENFSGRTSPCFSDCSVNSQIGPESVSNYERETQVILHDQLHSLIEGIAPNFLARHTEDQALYKIALSEMSLQNNIPSQHTPASYLDPVSGVVFGSQRGNPYYASDTHLGESLEIILSTWSSGQCGRQSMDEGSWAGAVRPHLGFPVDGAVGGTAFNEDCTMTVLEEEAWFGDMWSSAEGSDAVDVCNTQVLARELPSYDASSQDCDLPGARPQQAFASNNSPSQQYWNSIGARPRDLQYSTCTSHPSQPQQDDAVPVFTHGRQFSATTDWVSPVARPQQVQYSPVPVEESLQFEGEREQAGENLVGINIAFLLRHSADEALYTWALYEHFLTEEDVKKLRARIKRIETLIRERACKEEESQEMNSCNVPIHTAHKVPVQNCVSDNEIVDGQHQERYPCHPDICCICQEHIDAFIGFYEVPCGHKCHTDCYLNMLLDNIDTCPLCRQPI